MHSVRNIFVCYSILLYPFLESILENKFYLQAKTPIQPSNSSQRTVRAKSILDCTMSCNADHDCLYCEFLPHNGKCSLHPRRSPVTQSSNSSLVFMKCFIKGNCYICFASF